MIKINDLTLLYSNDFCGFVQESDIPAKSYITIRIRATQDGYDINFIEYCYCNEHGESYHNKISLAGLISQFFNSKRNDHLIFKILDFIELLDDNHKNLILKANDKVHHIKEQRLLDHFISGISSYITFCSLIMNQRFESESVVTFDIENLDVILSSTYFSFQKDYLISLIGTLSPFRLIAINVLSFINVWESIFHEGDYHFNYYNLQDKLLMKFKNREINDLNYFHDQINHKMREMKYLHNSIVKLVLEANNHFRNVKDNFKEEVICEIRNDLVKVLDDCKLEIQSEKESTIDSIVTGLDHVYQHIDEKADKYSKELKDRLDCESINVMKEIQDTMNKVIPLKVESYLKKRFN